MKKQFTEHDILIFLEESFPTINRGGDIHRDFAQIMGQRGMMLSMIHALVNDAEGDCLEQCRKSIQKVLTAKRKRVTR